MSKGISFNKNESILPMLLSKTGIDTEALEEVIFASGISGGADYVNDMPREIHIIRRIKNNTFSKTYIQKGE